MAKDCTIEDMTVDGNVHGDVIEVENHDGTKKFMASKYREIIPDQVYCANCSSYIPVGGLIDIDKAVKEHLEA